MSCDNLLNTQFVTKKKKCFIAPLVTTRNPHLPPLSKIIKKHFPVLQMSNTFEDTFSRPLAVINRQPPNLKSFLVKAKISKYFMC